MIQDLHFMVARLSQMEMVDFLWELWSLFSAIATIHWVELQKLNVVSWKTTIIGVEKYQNVILKVSVFAIYESCHPLERFFLEESIETKLKLKIEYIGE